MRMGKSNSGAQGPGIRRLPWRDFAGSFKGENRGMKMFSGGLQIASLSIIALVISIVGFCIIHFGKDFGDRAKADLSIKWGIACVVFAGLTALGFWLHVKRGGK